MIDIIVGGLYGDESKGQVAAWLTELRRKQTELQSYYFGIRVGGSNAEHRFHLPNGKKYTSRVMPTAAWVDPNIISVLGAGHVIKLDTLLKEIEELKELHGECKLLIDPQAGVIQENHVQQGKETNWRGSTHQGTGQAVVHKVKRDGTFNLAASYPELQPHIFHHGLPSLMNVWLQSGRRGLIEGSQGVLLSLNHGYYPYCTSKDTTPAALLAEAGVATCWLDKIYTIYRTVPMRVPGNSGPTGGAELTWEKLEDSISVEIPEQMKVQTDSGDRERVFLWSWEDFEKSMVLCNPDYIILTFLDWYPQSLMGMDIDAFRRRIENLTKKPIILLRYGPKWEDYIYDLHKHRNGVK